MMSMNKINLIDKMNEGELRNCISVVTAKNSIDKDEIIDYCEQRLERLSRDNVMVENSTVKPGELS